MPRNNLPPFYFSMGRNLSDPDLAIIEKLNQQASSGITHRAVFKRCKR
jgi:hypothetical protein